MIPRQPSLVFAASLLSVLACSGALAHDDREPTGWSVEAVKQSELPICDEARLLVRIDQIEGTKIELPVHGFGAMKWDVRDLPDGEHRLIFETRSCSGDVSRQAVVTFIQDQPIESRHVSAGIYLSEKGTLELYYVLIRTHIQSPSGLEIVQTGRNFELFNGSALSLDACAERSHFTREVKLNGRWVEETQMVSPIWPEGRASVPAGERLRLDTTMDVRIFRPGTVPEEVRPDVQRFFIPVKPSVVGISGAAELGSAECDYIILVQEFPESAPSLRFWNDREWRK